MISPPRFSNVHSPDIYDEEFRAPHGTVLIKTLPSAVPIQYLYTKPACFCNLVSFQPRSTQLITLINHGSNSVLELRSCHVVCSLILSESAQVLEVHMASPIKTSALASLYLLGTLMSIRQEPVPLVNRRFIICPRHGRPLEKDVISYLSAMYFTGWLSMHSVSADDILPH